jgi:SAM-dependent methyltransferase
MLHDPWLDRWLPLVVAHAGDKPVLEIGCGEGADTATLSKAGLQVVAFDLSEAAVRTTRLRVPSALVTCQDIRAPFPTQANRPGVVVASLSLHYFEWSETLAVVNRIRCTLQPGGLFLCRLNSTEDRNFGAQGHPEIEPNFYMVDGSPKRFFNEPAVRSLFVDGWKELSLEHFTTRKYLKSKSLWEAACLRDAQLAMGNRPVEHRNEAHSKRSIDEPRWPNAPTDDAT